MKILHILNEFENIGNGIVNVCCDLACEQAREGHEVTVVSNGGEFPKLLEKFGGTHVYLDQDRSVKNILKMLGSYRKIIKQYQPDIVHAHMMTGTVLANIFKRKFSYKLVTTVHNEYQKSSFLMKYADATVGVSAAVSAAMIKRGCNPEKTHTIINGTIGSPRRIAKQGIIPYELSHPSVVTIGQLSPRKGSDILFKAFVKLLEKHPTAHLYYVGNPDWTELVDEVKLSPYSANIHFVGLEKQPLKYLLSADVFAFPSLREPLGLVLIEAREAGVPIVASDVDGIPEALDNGHVGVLVPPGDIDILSEKLAFFIENPEVAKEEGKKGTFNLERFSTANMANQYVDLYRSLTN